MKTESGYLRDAEVLDSPWQTVSIPSALTPIGQLHQSLRVCVALFYYTDIGGGVRETQRAGVLNFKA